jgi:protein arginine kinase activator
MRCDDCGTAEATILIGQAGSLSSRIRLCAACASRRGVSGSGGVLRIDLDALFAAAGPDPAASSRTCPACGLSYEEFRREGRFGCPACVPAFASAHPPLAKRSAFAAGSGGNAP